MPKKIVKIKRPKVGPSDTKRTYRIDYKSALNPEQYQAVTTIEGPVLVIAGAGSGKTRVITYRTAFLAENGIQPNQIVLLTFTRRAASEMLGRAQALTGLELSNVQGGTFHSFTHKLLRRYGKQVGLGPNFTVMDQSDSEDAVKRVRDQLGLGGGKRRFPNKTTVFKIISKARNKGLSVEEVTLLDYPYFEQELAGIQKIAAGYEKLKRSRDLVDYDDLLFFGRDLLAGDSGRQIASTVKYVMADEYQDTNEVQAEIVQLLAQVHGNICVVGDDAQCIYTWRGSSFENILKFGDVFRKTVVVTLEQNYRSTQQVLDVANRVMAEAERSYTKILKAVSPPGERPWLVRPESATHQAEFITAKILELREEGVPLGELAVLCRAVWHLRELELELGRCNIPYVVFGGIKFAEAAHVKDLLAFLKVAVNPRDDIALKRILELLPGIGPSRSDRIIARAAAAQSPWDAIAAPDIKIPPGTAAKLGGMAALLKAIAGDGKNPAESVDAAKRYYRPLLREKFDDHPNREPDCDLMVNLASPYRSLQSFLSDMSLEPSRDRYQKHVEAKDNEDESLVLSTVHSAKGLEFHSVFIPHLVDGLFPSSRAFDDPEALEEERRIFYVAVTRAKEGLYLCQPIFVAAPYLKNSGISKISRFVDQAVAEQIDEIDIEWD